MNPVEVISKFMDAHKALKGLMEEKFKSFMEQPIKNIMTIMSNENCSAVEAFVKLQPFIDDNERASANVMYMAAVVEIQYRYEVPNAQVQRAGLPGSDATTCSGADIVGEKSQ